MEYNKLTREEEKLLYTKEPKGLLQENTPITKNLECMCAGAVTRLYITQMISLIRTVAGQALMMKCPEL